MFRLDRLICGAILQDAESTRTSLNSSLRRAELLMQVVPASKNMFFSFASPSTPKARPLVLLLFCFLCSRMRSEGSRFTWGSGGEAVFAKFCVCDRNRPQPLAVTP